MLQKNQYFLRPNISIFTCKAHFLLFSEKLRNILSPPLYHPWQFFWVPPAGSKVAPPSPGWELLFSLLCQPHAHVCKAPFSYLTISIMFCFLFPPKGWKNCSPPIIFLDPLSHGIIWPYLPKFFFMSIEGSAKFGMSIDLSLLWGSKWAWFLGDLWVSNAPHLQHSMTIKRNGHRAMSNSTKTVSLPSAVFGRKRIGPQSYSIHSPSSSSDFPIWDGRSVGRRRDHGPGRKGEILSSDDRFLLFGRWYNTVNTTTILCP